jgi:hypothetical protein
MTPPANLIVFARPGRDDPERSVAWVGEALGLREVAFLQIDGHRMWGCHSRTAGHGAASVGWRSGVPHVHVGLPSDWRRRWATLRECATDAARALGCVVWFCEPTDPLILMAEARPDGSVGPLRYNPWPATEQTVTPTDVVGTWTYPSGFDSTSITLDLKPEGAFVQTVRHEDGRVRTHEGTWTLEGSAPVLTVLKPASGEPDEEWVAEGANWWVVESYRDGVRFALFGAADDRDPHSCREFEKVS